MLLNYTSGVSPDRTASEIHKLLVKAGATDIGTRYHDGRMVGMHFAVVDHGDTKAFALPVRIGAVQDVLVKQRVEKRYQTMDHAERVAWRILKDWLKAQLAIIETGMVNFDQVMLPYMIIGGGTVYDHFRTYNEFPQLSA